MTGPGAHWRDIDAAWRLSRPRLAPFVLLLVVLGYGFAHWDRALEARGVDALAWALAGWWLLHAGTLWLNAVLDRDEGEVLLGEAVTPPPGLAGWGAVALALAVVVVAAGAPAALPELLGAVGLSLWYSWPRAPAKAHAVFGPAVNIVGYGVLSPLAGMAITGTPVSLRGAMVVGVVAMGVAGSYFLAQAFQGDEDRARGYATLVATGGPSAAVGAARGCFAAAVLGLGVLAAAGWLPRLILPGLALHARVDQALASMASRRDAGGASAAVDVARRVMHLAAVVFLLAFLSYVADSLRGGPVAGMATVRGHP